MTAGPIECERFDPYLSRRHWHVVHDPQGRHSFAVATAVPHQLAVRLLYLPARWPDEQRLIEVGQYIAAFELSETGLLPLRLPGMSAVCEQCGQAAGLVACLETLCRQRTLVEPLAAALLVPRPWLAAHVAAHGATRASMRQAAATLRVPLAAVMLVYQQPPQPAAARVHRHIRQLTGYPWFLPPALRQRYDPDQW